MNIRNIYNLLAIVAFIGLLACEKNVDVADQTSNVKHFYEQVVVENSKIKNAIGDTIWFSANFHDQFTDSKSKEVTIFENQTYLLHGNIVLLKPKFDTIPFIYENFDLVENVGSIQLMNVLNSKPYSYSFDIKFGRPLITNEARFGLILNYLGIFAIEYDCAVFYGPERDDYNDLSTTNSKSNIEVSFKTDNVNDSIFYNLPSAYFDYFQNYFNQNDISLNKFYFFEVDND